MGTFARESDFLPVSATLPVNYTGVIAASLTLWPTDRALGHSVRIHAN